MCKQKYEGVMICTNCKQSTTKNWFKWQASKYTNWKNRDLFEGLLTIFLVFVAVTLFGIYIGA
jgi:hypothetical protein